MTRTGAEATGGRGGAAPSDDRGAKAAPPWPPVALAPLRRRLLAAALALLGGACALPTRQATDRPWPWAEPRAAYLQRSQVWLGGDLRSWVAHMRTLDLYRGPAGADAFAPNELVRCDYVAPRADTFSGATQKFLCRRGLHDAPFKVKWGADDAEIYADVAGTRLLWALGFGTDRVYPVRVRCAGCADDPWRDPSPHPGSAPTFEPAIAERQFAGETIEEFPHQGWTWKELERVDAAAGGAPRAQLDALRLLAVFVQYRDSKADNQRLVCLPDGVEPSGASRTCRRPVALLDDLGSAFGGPHVFRTHKMELDYWAKEPVWQDARRCIANLTSELDSRDGLSAPRIGEDGRRFLATLLAGLRRRQIEDLFRAARAEARGALSGWVEVFERRRNEVLHPVPDEPAFRCPDAEASA